MTPGSGPPPASAEYEIIECRACDTQFNLAVQPYYTNLCPSCHAGDE